jgi:hypothetical protein
MRAQRWLDEEHHRAQVEMYMFGDLDESEFDFGTPEPDVYEGKMDEVMFEAGTAVAFAPTPVAPPLLLQPHVHDLWHPTYVMETIGVVVASFINDRDASILVVEYQLDPRTFITIPRMIVDPVTIIRSMGRDIRRDRGRYHQFGAFSGVSLMELHGDFGLRERLERDEIGFQLDETMDRKASHFYPSHACEMCGWMDTCNGEDCERPLFYLQRQLPCEPEWYLFQSSEDLQYRELKMWQVLPEHGHPDYRGYRQRRFARQGSLDY